jgi:hypothetical protein
MTPAPAVTTPAPAERSRPELAVGAAPVALPAKPDARPVLQVAAAPDRPARPDAVLPDGASPADGVAAAPEGDGPPVGLAPGAGQQRPARPDAPPAQRSAVPSAASPLPGEDAGDEGMNDQAPPAKAVAAPDLPEVAPARVERAAAEPLPALQRSPPAPPALQVGVQLAAAAARRVERVVVQLEPAALGRVEVRLDFSHDNRVSALIAVDRPETMDLLQRDGRALERALQDAGLKLDGGGLSFSLRQDQRQPERGAPAVPGRAWQAVPVESAGAAPERASPWLAAERLLDIRI